MAASELFSCTKCSKTFDAQGKYNQHLKTHSKPYACETCGRGFGLRADLSRHTKARHRVGNEKFICSVPDCKSNAARKDNIAQHMKKYHPEILQVQSLTSGKHRQTVSHDSETPFPKAPPIAPVLLSHWWEMATAGNVSSLEAMLRAGYDIDAKAGDGSTALHCAAQAGQTAAIDLLLAKGAQLNIKNDKGRTPLFLSAVFGQSRCIMMLLQAGGSVTSFEPQNKGSALGFVDHIVRLGDTELVEAVLQSSCVYPKQDRSEKAFILAIAAAKTDQVPILQAIVNSDPEAFHDRGSKLTPIMYAVNRGHVAAFRTLIIPSGFSNEPEDRDFPLRLGRLQSYAARGGSLKILDTLLNLGSSIDHMQPMAFIAAARGHLDFLKALLGRGALVDAQDGGCGIALRLAAERGHLDIVKTLLDYGARYDLQNRPYNQTALHLAAQYGHLDIVKSLLDYGACHDLQDGDSDTALHLSARFGHMDIVEALISRGAQHDLLNLNKKTPLLTAFWQNKLDVVQLLSRYDVSILKPQEDCMIATSLATVALRLLEQKKLSIKSQGNFEGCFNTNKTLLHLAAEFGDLELARLVLDHHDWDLQDTNTTAWFLFHLRETALDHAQRKGHTEIVDLLLAHGAKSWRNGALIEPVQPAPSRIEPAHSNEQTDSEMQQDGDYILDSDLEEQPYSYIDEHIAPHASPPIVSAVDGPPEAEHSTQTRTSTVAAERHMT